jgi:hypothetical protein
MASRIGHRNHGFPEPRDLKSATRTSTVEASRPISGTTPTARGSAPTQHAIGNWRELTRNNGQTANRQKPEFAGPFKIRTSTMAWGYYRTSSPVTALPMMSR